MLVLTLGALSIAFPLLIAFLRDRGWARWMLLGSALAATAVGIITLGATLETGQKIGIFLLYCAPCTSVFLLPFFLERRALIAVLGPFAFAAGFFLALSLAVGLGLLQP